MLFEGEPAQDGTDEGAEELGDDVDGNVGAGDGNSASLDGGTVEGDVRVEHVADDLGDRDGGVQVAAGAEGDVDAGEDREAPSPVDEKPAAAFALGFGQEVGGDDATTEEKQNRCAEELRPENLAGGRGSRVSGCRKQC